VYAGQRRVLIVMPTGGGKTVTAAYACRSHVAKNGRVLWVAHRRELIQQAYDTFDRSGIQAGAFGLNGGARIQIESVQSLIHPRREEVPPASMLVVDECHHLLATEWIKLSEIYKDCLLLGLTATPERSDGKAMGDVFDALVVAAQVRDLIALHDEDPTVGLVPCHAHRPRHPDGSPWVLRSDEVAQRPFEAYLEFSPAQRALVFAPNVPAAKEFSDQFNRAGIPCDYVHGKMPKDERDSVLKLFRRGELRVVVSCQILTEGFDDPGCSVCIIARGCNHASLYLQMVGRVMRPAPGKMEALLIDLRGVSYIHGMPGADRTFSLEGDAIVPDEVEEEKHCPICQRIMEGRKCSNPQCNKVGEEKELVTPHSVDAQMAYVRWDDPRGDDTISARMAKLAQWMRDARAQGKPAQSAVMKYHYAYHYFPSASERRDAALLAGIDPGEVAKSDPPPPLVDA